MSIIKTNNIQLGQSSTIDNNITVAVPAVPDGTFKISKGVPGDTSVDLLEVSGNKIKLNDPIFSFGGSEGTEGQVLISQGSGVSPLFATLQTTPTIKWETRTSNTIIQSIDTAKMIEITSGTFTQTFDACASLGSDWFVYIKNSGTGDITLDPDGSETIDGLTSYIMYPGEVRLIQCDGFVLRSVVLNGFYKVFESSGDFIKPPGYRAFEGLLWGGGGGGRKQASTASVCYGGTGAGCAHFVLSTNSLNLLESVVIGAGGLGATVEAGNGSPGGNSSFAGLDAFRGNSGSTSLTQPGGSALDNGANSDIAPVIGGGVFSSSTTPGRPYYGGASNGGYGTNTVFGGAAGGLLNGGSGSNNSRSIFGGQHVIPMSNGTVDGNVPGGGGAPTNTGARAGNGARGELRIWGVI